MARLAAANAPATSQLVLPSVRIARFFRKHLRHGKGSFMGRPFVLEEWEAANIAAIYDPRHVERDPVIKELQLLRDVREAVIGVAKKNGKTHLAAGLGLYHLTSDGYWRLDGTTIQDAGWIWTLEGGAEVYNVAASKDQAKVLFELGRHFVKQSPYLRALCKPYRDVIEVPETGAVWRVLASDAELAHGPNPSAAIIDELWAHRTPDLYTAFQTSGAARRQPLLATITTAGWNQEGIAHALYKEGRRWEKAKRRSKAFYFHWYEAPPKTRIDDPKALRAANPSPHVTPAYLRGQLSRLRKLGLESEFYRFHRNNWRTTKEIAIPIELWDSCDARPRFGPGTVVMIGVDSAPKRDSTGVVICHRDGAGTHHWRTRKMTADPDSGYLDYDALEDALREACRVYDVLRIFVDPYNMTRSMLLLQDEGLPIEEFPQGDARMVPASMNLYELCVEGRLRHGGDSSLREAVLGAGKKVTERGWRLYKRSSGVIDVLVAGTMASYAWELPTEEEEPATPGMRLFEFS